MQADHTAHLTQSSSHLFFGMTVHRAVWDLNSKLLYPPPLPTQYCKIYLAFGLIVLFFSATLLLILRYLYFQTGTLQTECKRYVYNVNKNGVSFLLLILEQHHGNVNVLVL